MHQTLINVITPNICGAMFLYVEDFLGMTKDGKLIAEFLLKAIEGGHPMSFK